MQSGDIPGGQLTGCYNVHLWKNKMNYMIVHVGHLPFGTGTIYTVKGYSVYPSPDPSYVSAPLMGA